jgi:hypothetical protein
MMMRDATIDGPFRAYRQPSIRRPRRTSKQMGRTIARLVGAIEAGFFGSQPDPIRPCGD